MGDATNRVQACLLLHDDVEGRQLVAEVVCDEADAGLLDRFTSDTMHELFDGDLRVELPVFAALVRFDKGLEGRHVAGRSVALTTRLSPQSIEAAEGEFRTDEVAPHDDEHVYMTTTRFMASKKSFGKNVVPLEGFGLGRNLRHGARHNWLDNGDEEGGVDDGEGQNAAD